MNHSGKVKEVPEGKPPIIHSKWGDWGDYEHEPDAVVEDYGPKQGVLAMSMMSARCGWLVACAAFTLAHPAGRSRT